MTILFTCAGRRNYLLKYFKQILGNDGKIIACDSERLAPALAEADVRLQVPKVFDPGYVDALKDIIRTYDVDAVISLNDLELPILAANKTDLEILGARIMVSDIKTIDICFDKWKSYQFFKELDIATPKTYLNPADAIADIKKHKLSFPLILKPRWGSGSFGIEIADNEVELLLYHQLLNLKICKAARQSGLLTDPQDCVIIQEKILADEYGMDILNDLDGNYFGSFARKKLAMRSGETDRAMSVINRKFSEIGAKISAALGHIGNMDCDFFLLNNEVYFLEMNPRFGGGYPFSHEAGINTPAIYLSWLNGNTHVAQYNNYMPDLIFAKCDSIIPIPTLMPPSVPRLRKQFPPRIVNPF